MKRSVFAASTLILFAILGSCSRDFDPTDPSSSSGTVISFTDNDGPSSRGALTPKGAIKSFKVYSYHTTSDFASTPTPKVWMDGVDVIESDGVWSYTPKYYWPADGSLSFFAFTPLSTENNGIKVVAGAKTPAVEYTVPNIQTRQPDLMIAIPQTNISEEPPLPVKFKFRHALTAIAIRVIGNGQQLSGLTFKDAFRVGEANVDIETTDPIVWSNHSDKGRVDVHLDPSVLGKKLTDDGILATLEDDYLLMIPQDDLSKVALEAQFDGTTREFFFPAGAKWESGKVLTYVIDFTKNSIIRYGVTYHANGASGNVPVDPESYWTGEDVTVVKNSGTLSKPSYTFAGWNTEADGSGTAYANLASFRLPEGGVTLYAQWAGGTVPRVTVEGRGGDATLVITTDPTDAGLYFKFGSVVGVYSADGANQKFPAINIDTFSPSDIAFNPMAGSPAIATYAAIPSYVVSDYDALQKDVSAPTYHNGDNIALGKGDPCKLVGLTANQVRAKIADGSIASYSSGWRLPRSTEHYALFNVNTTLAIPFLNSAYPYWWTNGEVNSPSGGIAGATFPLKLTLSRNLDPAGFYPANGRRRQSGNVDKQQQECIYWYSDVREPTEIPPGHSNKNSLGCYYHVNDEVIGQVYPLGGNGDYQWGMGARCVRDANIMTFNPNNGQTPKKDMYVSGGTIGTEIDLPKPTREGHEFRGWYTAISGGTLITDGIWSMPSGSITVYAQWYKRVAPRITTEGSGDDAKLVITYDPLKRSTYFKFGSVVGVHNKVAGTWDSKTSLVFNPTTTNSYVYGALPMYDGAAGGNITKRHTGEYVKKGMGDPCKIIGLTAGQIRIMTNTDIEQYESGWRLPTQAENQAFAGYNTTTSTSAHWETATKYGVPGGSFPNITTAPANKFLSAFGYIYNEQQHTNTDGDYWSSDAYSATEGYALAFTQTTVHLQSYDALHSFAVRCVVDNKKRGLTLDLGYTGAESSQVLKVKIGDVPKFPLPSRSGYKFRGWFTATTGGRRVDDGAWKMSKDYDTVYAQWYIPTAPRITVDESDKDARLAITDDPIRQSIHFKFGSVVGLRNEVNTVWDKTASPVFNPTSTNSYEYANLPKYNGAANGNVTKQHTGALVKDGRGDPCKIIGLTAKQIKNMTAAEISKYKSGWRLPTHAENKAFAGYGDGLTSTSVHWENITKYGAYGASFLTDKFLPACGYVEDGILDNNNLDKADLAHGDYWSSDADVATKGYALAFTRNGVYLQLYSVNYGFAVRCVTGE